MINKDQPPAYELKQKINASVDNLGRIALSDEELADWRSKRMLFICGPHGSGKSSLAKATLEGGFPIFDLGPLIRSVHERRNSDVSFEQWVKNNENICGPDFTAAVLVQIIKRSLQNKHNPNGTAMVGNRSLSGIEYFKNEFEPVDSVIVYFDAPPSILYSRYLEREKTSLGMQEFHSLLETDNEMGLQSVRLAADYVVQNTGDFDAARSKLRTIVDTWLPHN